MNNKPAAFLILLSLLTFCGQLVAAPFLACDNAAGVPPAMAADCDLLMAMPAPETGGDPDPAPDETSAAQTDSADCGQLCLQCPGCVILPSEPARDGLAPSLVNAGATDLPPSPSGSLYRPPIPA